MNEQGNTPRGMETDLYAPVKALLEGQGYVVKSEIGAADVFAVRDETDIVIVELKQGFTLQLLHQAVDRLAITDTVYVAVPEWKGRAGWKAFSRNQTLCRRLGLGVITVHGGVATARLDPVPYQPRASKVRRNRLLAEFQKRVGDPNTGGSTRRTLMTAYRQDALRCLMVLSAQGALKAARVAEESGVARARAIMYADHYGWFERAGGGVYRLSQKGLDALAQHADELDALR